MSVDDPAQGTDPVRAEDQAAERPEEAPPTADTTARQRGWAGLRPLVLRLHFYAGVLIAPFLLVAAVTGTLYAASFQIEKYLYADELRVPVGEHTVPLSRQVRAALDAHPDGTLTSVRPSAEDGATTQVILSDPSVAEDKSLTVFVDPYTAKVRGALESDFGALPFRSWVSDLHGNLHLGEPGRLYSELAASWLWVVALGGLLLWVKRKRDGRGARGLLLPERGAKGRKRTLTRHGAVGLWAVLGLVFLSATGLTWSTYAGEKIDVLRTELRGATPAITATLPGAGEMAGGSGHGDHAGHGGGGGSHAKDPDIGIDRVFAVAREKKLTEAPLEIAAPSEGGAYVVKQIDKQWPVHLDSIAVHPGTGAVVDELRFADYPLLAKLTRWGIDGHSGVLFGLANQIALAALMLGLILLIVWGYRMWWQRRPARERRLGVGRPTPRGTWRRVPLPTLLPLVGALAVVGWLVPLFGIGLVLFLAVDTVVGLVARLVARSRSARA
ncbi:PepSY domain-containing protein [Streptomyces sp. XD-27]|uniref:PepSY-associated TM helix domain-containing protein n=1 Tax=Streptomyces sp. XD-27 TaxID=3062779 RepID=UPI0026F464BA|nr:PepSY domain-containing protein [Streptomyces sp. XD-27]WKX73795.1 PepSY domain-containing protein [Streptomyces sp. XD-27]